MRRTTIPVENLFAWGKLNGVEFINVDVKSDITSQDGVFRGAGLVSTCDRSSKDSAAVLVSVPQDLILSREQVDRYAAIDKPLKSVLDAAGAFGKTARGAILIFLLVQITNASPDFDGPISVTNPHTDYVKLLPETVLLPTYYTDEEKDLLYGTSLDAALDQKLRSLENEFEELQGYTRDIAWCQKYWWDRDSGKMSFDDWMLVDALYRSRALNLPGTGNAMVPCIDMANHMSGIETIASYETGADGGAILQIRPGTELAADEEVTITYGDEKGACEMIFSYGFLEPGMSGATAIFLDFQIPDDDPLRMAKKTVNKEAPGVRLFVNSNGKLDWEGNYIWWACVNEEDGLDFRVTQENDGNRRLEVLWKDQHIDPSQLSKTLESDLKWDIFQLRAIVMLQDRVSRQANNLEASEESFMESQGQSGIRDGVRILIGQLRVREAGLLAQFDRLFEEQKTDLLSSDTVRRYLEEAQANVDSHLPPETNEDDFA
ncbi:hypothetical protein EPUS_02618 [Endocarpon pusillum Z07020]|uniref:SET domain-containing protein n=1 Tax=Endocarpon pusillum (strain Z07020 / HMAS-L-300199) TaxID=1263415 RepID=U1GGV3_ENDPU|nr:uncharacterized protein EPUS_02618 [Endocarpon pusillum Z07020]ERF76907.1 hypothetical protein EPUS_02618 [Endocarpon pusillum Z07020]